MPVVHGRRRHLCDEGLRVAQHPVYGCATEVERVPHQPVIEPQALAGARHHSAGRGALTHENRNAHQALSAHDGNLTCGAALRDEQQRHDGGGRKEYLSGRVAGLVKHLAQSHVQPFQLRPPAQQHICGKRRNSDSAGDLRHKFGFGAVSNCSTSFVLLQVGAVTTCDAQVDHVGLRCGSNSIPSARAACTFNSSSSSRHWPFRRQATTPWISRAGAADALAAPAIRWPALPWSSSRPVPAWHRARDRRPSPASHGPRSWP